MKKNIKTKILKMKLVSCKAKVGNQCGIAIWIVATLIMTIGNVQAQEHPFLIVKKSQYAELQARASNWPWNVVKADAISKINSAYYNASADYDTRGYQMSKPLNAGCLAYILDPENRTSYKNKMLDLISYWDDLWEGRDDNGWNVVITQALWETVMAFDIMYDDLTADERDFIEGKIVRTVDYFYTFSFSAAYKWGACGIWAVFKGDRGLIDEAKSKWKTAFFERLTSDGVFADGGTYAGDSENDRPSKMMFYHVLEFTGEDTTYYSDHRLAGYYEWFFGASITPFKKHVIFSDCILQRFKTPYVAPVYFAKKISEKAAKYAAWNAQGVTPDTDLYCYLLAEDLPAPEKPKSGIWSDGCAAFWEDNSSSRSLMGVLWNLDNAPPAASHLHKEVNAIHIAGYGEQLIRNGGWCIDDPPNFYNDADAASVMLIDNINHSFKYGDGITEGFTASKFDYASGSSGNALPNGHHQRNFILVHPQDGCNGYWVLFDEVLADSSSSQVNSYLHRNAYQATTISDKTEYRAKGAEDNYSGHTVYTTIFFGTPPASVSEGLSPNSVKYPHGDRKYLKANYNVNSEKKANVVTVIFPHDDTHAKAAMSRISGSGYSGAEVNLGDSVVDIAIESSDTSEVIHNGVSFRGTAGLYRLNNDSIGFYFVRGGRSFNDGATPCQGFASDTNAGVYIKDREGKITSLGAEVTFYYPGITDVLINGVSASVLDLGDDWIQINVPSGTHDIELVTIPTPRGAITGTVTDDNTGNPIQGATISDGTGYTDTDAVGNYILSYVPVNSYTISASKTAYFSLSTDSVDVTENDTVILDFQLIKIPAGTITGTVTDDSTGNPIQGATVSDGTRSDSTDAGGNYTLTDVPVNSYTITASKSGYFSLSVDSVVVTENGTSILDFQLSEIPIGAISGTVTDNITGIPIQGAMVSDGTRSESTDAVGNFILTDVPIDTYTVTATKSGYYPLSIDNVTVTVNDTIIIDLQLIQESDLVGFWAFEETSGTTAYDSSGLNNDGIIYGPTSTSGRLDLAYQFDGSDDYIKVPKSASLDGITEAITLIAWVKLPAVNLRYSIFDRWLTGDAEGRSFEFDIEKGKVWFGLCGDGTFSDGVWLQSSNTVTSDTWTHLAATSDGSTMKIYFNGVADPMTGTPPSSIHPSVADLHIGKWEFASDDWYYPFDGTMDEVKIFSRALTTLEIEDDYNLVLVGINENRVSLPLDGFLQAYPNPFNYSTTIGYKTVVAGKVTISIYNLSGQKIRTLVNETRQAGHHSMIWDGTNATGGSAGSGIYFCILHIDNRPVATNKIVLLE